MTAQSQRFGLARAIDLLLALRQRDQTRRLDPEHAEGVQRRVELALAAVDQQHVGEDLLLLLQATKAATDDLADRGEVVNALDAPDAEASVARLEGQSVEELHQRGDRLGAAEMSDVNALDGARGLLQPQHLAQADQPFLRVDGKDLWLDVALDIAALAEFLQCRDVIAQPRRPLELHLRAGVEHFLLHLAKQTVLLPFQDHAQGADLLTVILLADAEVTRSGALVDAVQETRTEPAPARVLGVDVQRAGAELEQALEHLHGVAQALGAGERPVEANTPATRRARELDAREIFANADLQIGE